MYTLYGIPNCNSVQKARTWLDNHNIPYFFHDYKKEGISKVKLDKWCKELGWEIVLNKNGTTWKELDESAKNEINTQAKAVALMMEYTSSIKRPIIERDGNFLVMRFDEDRYKELFL